MSAERFKLTTIKFIIKIWVKNGKENGKCFKCNKQGEKTAENV